MENKGEIVEFAESKTRSEEGILRSLRTCVQKHVARSFFFGVRVRVKTAVYSATYGNAWKMRAEVVSGCYLNTRGPYMSVHCTAWWYWKLNGSPPSNCCPLSESCTRASPASWKSLVGSMKRT